MRPDVFAAVMATGIVSIAAADHGHHIISDVLVVLAAVALPVLIVMVARAWRGFDFRDPDVPLGLFTYVAACAVLAARLAEHRIVLWVLAGMALQGWLSLAPLVARGMWQHRGALRERAHGGVGTGERGDLRIGHRVSRSRHRLLGRGVLGVGDVRVPADDRADRGGASTCPSPTAGS